MSSDNSFRDHFRQATVDDLVAALNREAGNPGWTSARGMYLAALHEAFLATGIDCSSFISAGKMAIRRIRLADGKLVAEGPAPVPPANPSPLPAQLIYGHGHSGLVFIEREVAADLDAFHTAATWGEFRKRAPDLCAEVLELMGCGDKEDVDSAAEPSDDAALDRTQIPGYEDGDFPAFPEQMMLNLIPESVQERFGEVVETVFSGAQLVLSTEREEEIVAALIALGFNCQRDQALIGRVYA